MVLLFGFLSFSFFFLSFESDQYMGGGAMGDGKGGNKGKGKSS